jgi:hypothetical protein
MVRLVAEQQEQRRSLSCSLVLSILRDNWDNTEIVMSQPLTLNQTNLFKESFLLVQSTKPTRFLLRLSTAVPNTLIL